MNARKLWQIFSYLFLSMLVHSKPLFCAKMSELYLNYSIFDSLDDELDDGSFKQKIIGQVSDFMDRLAEAANEKLDASKIKLRLRYELLSANTASIFCSIIDDTFMMFLYPDPEHRSAPGSIKFEIKIDSDDTINNLNEDELNKFVIVVLNVAKKKNEPVQGSLGEEYRAQALLRGDGKKNNLFFKVFNVSKTLYEPLIQALAEKSHISLLPVPLGQKYRIEISTVFRLVSSLHCVVEDKKFTFKIEKDSPRIEQSKLDEIAKKIIDFSSQKNLREFPYFYKNHYRNSGEVDKINAAYADTLIERLNSLLKEQNSSIILKKESDKNVSPTSLEIYQQEDKQEFLSVIIDIPGKAPEKQYFFIENDKVILDASNLEIVANLLGELLAAEQTAQLEDIPSTENPKTQKIDVLSLKKKDEPETRKSLFYKQQFKDDSLLTGGVYDKLFAYVGEQAGVSLYSTPEKNKEAFITVSNDKEQVPSITIVFNIKKGHFNFLKASSPGIFDENKEREIANDIAQRFEGISENLKNEIQYYIPQETSPDYRKIFVDTINRLQHLVQQKNNSVVFKQVDSQPNEKASKCFILKSEIIEQPYLVVTVIDPLKNSSDIFKYPIIDNSAVFETETVTPLIQSVKNLKNIKLASDDSSSLPETKIGTEKSSKKNRLKTEKVKIDFTNFFEDSSLDEEEKKDITGGNREFKSPEKDKDFGFALLNENNQQEELNRINRFVSKLKLQNQDAGEIKWKDKNLKKLIQTASQKVASFDGALQGAYQKLYFELCRLIHSRMRETPFLDFVSSHSYADNFAKTYSLILEVIKMQSSEMRDVVYAMCIAIADAGGQKNETVEKKFNWCIAHVARSLLALLPSDKELEVSKLDLSALEKSLEKPKEKAPSPQSVLEDSLLQLNTALKELRNKLQAMRTKVSVSPVSKRTYASHAHAKEKNML